MTEKEIDIECKRIAKLIDPDNTFLEECDNICKERFRKEDLIKLGIGSRV